MNVTNSLCLPWNILVFFPFPFPQSSLTLCNPMDYTVHGILQPRILEWVAFSFPGDLSNPGIEPRSPALQADSLPTELSGKPPKVKVTQSCLTLCNPGRNSPGQNTGVGCHSLLQGVFPTQGLNPGLPHCRWILYQLSLEFVIFFLQCF